MSGTLRKIQSEHLAWRARNFPSSGAVHATLGIVEEFGELEEADAGGFGADVLDAAGDIVIYMAHLCNDLGLDLQDLWVARRPTKFRSIPRWLGKLSHAVLKAEQGIRGTRAQHQTDAAICLQVLLWMLSKKAAEYDIDVVEAAERTWAAVVSKRDWVANATTGAAE